MNRPGGNITGVTSLNAQFGQKRLELLHELLPAADLFALLSNPTNQRNADVTIGLLQAAARALRLKLHLLQATGRAASSRRRSPRRASSTPAGWW